MPITGQPRYQTGYAALLLIRAPGFKDSEMAAIFSRHYHLTRAETKLMGTLIAGLDLKEFAESTFSSYETVRSHLKRIYAKTGTHRRHELISLVRGVVYQDQSRDS